MQKDLLAELHLPKLNLKSLESIVTQNSKRLACVIKENNEFIKKSKVLPPGIKVVMGGKLLDIDVNFPLSASAENVKTVKRKFIIKKALRHNEIPCKDNLEKSPLPSVINGSAVTPKPVKDSFTEDAGKAKCVEFRPLVTKKHNSNSRVPSAEASLDNSPVASTETESFMGTVASSTSDEDAEVQILLDKSSNKCSESNHVPSNSNRSLLKTDIKIRKPIVKSSIVEDAVVSSTSNDAKGCGRGSALEESSGTAMCVISEVIGNAHTAFSGAGEPQENASETPETQLITPQKTNDITKIKGWRRKQFFVEKPTTVEFYSVSKGSRSLKKKIELINTAEVRELNEEPGNKENAFVCDSLNEFLEQEADLKIGYEVPHLFAEYGIKLTSDEIVSRPSLSERDLKEVEMRYCVPVPLPIDNTNLDDISEDDVKGVKRPIEDDTEPSKSLKLEECKSQSVRYMQKQAKKPKTEQQSNPPAAENKTKDLQKHDSSQSQQNFNNIKLLSKLIALVVYPGPFKPLHPIVRYHLDKLRSYRTDVDENWASFAASAVVVKERRCKRRIVPAYCCVKTERNLAESDEQTPPIDQTEDNGKQIKLKECRVVIKRLKPSRIGDPWCMEHSCYNCSPCGLARKKTAGGPRCVQKSLKSIKRRELEEEQGETVTVSPRASFNKKIARLLAKKVRLLKANGDTLRSIDSLKIIKHDTIEFIKLKFVKESFLTGYINIWYLKPETAAVRSRAFLTFSQSPPVPNAVNLKSTGLSLNNLPKVITEIVSEENTFDSNEYAILHCNGGNWEIHGSLNITFGNSDKYVEQIFTCLELPELKRLQEIAEKILHVKAVKWWVLDLTQKFKLIELRSGNFSTVVTRKKFLDVIKLNSFGFIPLRQDFDNRVLGAYVIQRLLPFVLIGPYYLLETRDMILKGVSSTVPFKYYGEDAVTTNYPLKFFINSVIKNLERKNNKKLEGLWLYDKMCLDKTSYIEVVTTDLESKPPDKCSIIEIEHGYSLNSLTHTSPSGATSGIVKRKDGKHELQTVTVYLYFDIFELGFLEGELQFDNSVIINHPIDGRTKMKSHKIGDWFISIIRRKVVFLPKDLPVRWYITKHKEDLRERLPFNKFILGGAHIITKIGVFYLLELSQSLIEKLGLDKNEIVKIMSQCEVLNEVRELKNLSELLITDPDKSLSMHRTLIKAVKEIKRLQKIQKDLESEKLLAETKKLKLAYDFIKLVNSFNIRSHFKLKMIENIEHLFRLENGQLNKEFVNRLKQRRAGWNYLKQLERNGGKVITAETKKQNFTNRISELIKDCKWETSKSAAMELLIRSLQKLSNGMPSHKNPASNALNSASGVAKIVNNPPIDKELQDSKLSSTSEELSSLKMTEREIIKTGRSGKKPRKGENADGRKNKITKTVVLHKSKSNLTAKADGFIKLSSADLPNNIKLRWKNLNLNKRKLT